MKQGEYFGVSLEDDPDIQVTRPESPTLKARFWPEIRSVLRDVIFASLMTVLIVVFVVQPVKVVSTSMMPRLEDSERIFVNKFGYYLSSIRRGDIVVFWYPEDPSQSFIKRVIGLPGERIDMDSAGRITINGKPIEEPYLAPERNQAARARWGQVRDDFKFIKPHFYFVMGDNRDVSNDSRSWGLVPEKYIYGRAICGYWPLPRLGSLDGEVDKYRDGDE
ncbi:MAG TPA: signal peptidase I [Blastocatellia bacterium]|jgi:signal peptidase I|nr:signal peptidase I [Blastocatellia bacterium]